MPRTAQSPNKGDIPAPPIEAFQDAEIIIKDPDYKPDITLAILTHYDCRQEYHYHRIPVVDLCVRTMLDGAAGHDCELLIFDNGSTADFRKHLKTYEADTLILSPNLGKQSAQVKMLEYARGDVFCFTDDDIYFYPGWLDKHLEILDTYPDRPMLVSGSPQRTAFTWGMKSNLRWINRNINLLTVGNLISEESERQYARSIGKAEVAHMLRIIGLNDYLVTFRGVKAWAHAHHMQFIARRKYLEGKLPESHYLVDNAREWDMLMDHRGFMRFTTYERTVLHIGNELQGDVTYFPRKAEA